MDQSGPELPWVDQRGLEWNRVAPEGTRGDVKCAKWPRLPQSGPEWPRVVKSGPVCAREDQSEPEWTKEDPKWSERTPECFRGI